MQVLGGTAEYPELHLLTDAWLSIQSEQNYLLVKAHPAANTEALR